MKNKYELKRHFLWPVDRSVALCFVSFLFIFFIRFYSGRRLRSWEERQVSSGVGDGARTISFFFFFFLLGACFVEVRVASSSDHRTKSVVARYHRGSERGQVNRNATTTTESRLAVIENTLIAAPICGFNFSSLTSHLPMRRVPTAHRPDTNKKGKEQDYIRRAGPSNQCRYLVR